MRYLAFMMLAFSVIVSWSSPKVSSNEPSRISDWRAKNWGLENNEAWSHVFAPDAWALAKTHNRTLVAVIDTGIAATHPKLMAYISKDGFNFVTNTATPVDDHGHGTHVAGIILAVSDFHATILPIKYYSDANPGSVNLKNTVKAVEYAIDHGAKVINYSGGGPEPSEEEYLALKKAETKGVLVVTAAGNEHQNTDIPENKYYPAAYRLSNMISVAATDIHNNLLASSNWGKLRVDVSAPGEVIYSTLLGDRFGYMSGTSQATAFVSGIAALLLAENPKLKVADLRRIILETVDIFPQQQGKTVTGGRVNAYTALKRLKESRPFTKAKE